LADNNTNKRWKNRLLLASLDSGLGDLASLVDLLDLLDDTDSNGLSLHKTVSQCNKPPWGAELGVELTMSRTAKRPRGG
jgi:hypothetical protein